MTRGKIILFGPKNMLCESLEFNGDMYPEGHGKQIIRAFQRGEILDQDAYERFVSEFDETHFGYSREGLGLTSISFMKNDEVYDVRDNLTDYLYIINCSGTNRFIQTKESRECVETGQLAILHYREWHGIVDMSQEGRNAKKSAEVLTELLECLKETNALMDELKGLLEKGVLNLCGESGTAQ